MRDEDTLGTWRTGSKLPPRDRSHSSAWPEHSWDIEVIRKIGDATLRRGHRVNLTGAWVEEIVPRQDTLHDDHC